MPIRKESELQNRFRDLLSKSESVDIAVAWATDCDPIDALEMFCEDSKKLRIVVGTDGNSTNPATLRRIHSWKNAQLRIARSPKGNGIFHTKYYCFRSRKQTTVWIGSANLTRRGFALNSELILESSSLHESDKWFDNLWSCLETNPITRIRAYERNWTPSFEDYSNRSSKNKVRKTKSNVALGRLDSNWTWEEFVLGLKKIETKMLQDALAEGKSEAPWSVFGDHQSWLATIRAGNPLTRLQSWRSLEYWQLSILLGRDQWGALGTLGGAGKANGIFLGRSKKYADIRQDILKHLKTTTLQDVDAIQAGVSALNGIRSHLYIGPGVATRLLALSRPDRYVSANSASCSGLAECSGLPKTLKDRRYGDLLEWVYGSKWYSAPRPQEPLEQEIWDSRAALIDAFVYLDS